MSDGQTQRAAVQSEVRLHLSLGGRTVTTSSIKKTPGLLASGRDQKGGSWGMLHHRERGRLGSPMCKTVSEYAQIKAPHSLLACHLLSHHPHLFCYPLVTASYNPAAQTSKRQRVPRQMASMDRIGGTKTRPSLFLLGSIPRMACRNWNRSRVWYQIREFLINFTWQTSEPPHLSLLHLCRRKCVEPQYP